MADAFRILNILTRGGREAGGSRWAWKELEENCLLSLPKSPLISIHTGLSIHFLCGVNYQLLQIPASIKDDCVADQRFRIETKQTACCCISKFEDTLVPKGQTLTQLRVFRAIRSPVLDDGTVCG